MIRGFILRFQWEGMVSLWVGFMMQLLISRIDRIRHIKGWCNVEQKMKSNDNDKKCPQENGCLLTAWRCNRHATDVVGQPLIFLTRCTCWFPESTKCVRVEFSAKLSEKCKHSENEIKCLWINCCWLAHGAAIETRLALVSVFGPFGVHLLKFILPSPVHWFTIWGKNSISKSSPEVNPGSSLPVQRPVHDYTGHRRPWKIDIRDLPIFILLRSLKLLRLWTPKTLISPSLLKHG